MEESDRSAKAKLAHKRNADCEAQAVLLADLGEPPVLSAQTRRGWTLSTAASDTERKRVCQQNCLRFAISTALDRVSPLVPLTPNLKREGRISCPPSINFLIKFTRKNRLFHFADLEHTLNSFELLDHLIRQWRIHIDKGICVIPFGFICHSGDI